MIHGSPEGRLKLLARHLKGRRPTSSSGMSPITTHVLDTAKGTPAMGLPISLEYLGNGAVETVAAGVTNDDGRIPGFMDSQAELRGGLYRMTFNTAAYYERLGEAFFYPEASHNPNPHSDPNPNRNPKPYPNPGRHPVHAPRHPGRPLPHPAAAQPLRLLDVSRELNRGAAETLNPNPNPKKLTLRSPKDDA
mmetsp:Transcript_41953/g.131466  ORF Transcript_41953/g.131466 Transcript_41953/m.131466 type:complete len:192 (-) Transcript_41953:56-631(-)